MPWSVLRISGVPVTALLALALWFGLGREPALRLALRLGLRGRLLSLQESRAVVNAGAARMLQAAGWHVLAWLPGTAEVWVILAVLGTPVGLPESFAIKSLGMAARNIGFVLPAGLGA